jgi:hypothetical protein
MSLAVCWHNTYGEFELLNSSFKNLTYGGVGACLHTLMSDAGRLNLQKSVHCTLKCWYSKQHSEE